MPKLASPSELRRRALHQTPASSQLAVDDLPMFEVLCKIISECDGVQKTAMFLCGVSTFQYIRVYITDRNSYFEAVRCCKRFWEAGYFATMVNPRIPISGPIFCQEYPSTSIAVSWDEQVIARRGTHSPCWTCSTCVFKQNDCLGCERHTRWTARKTTKPPELIAHSVGTPLELGEKLINPGVQFLDPTTFVDGKRDPNDIDALGFSKSVAGSGMALPLEILVADLVEDAAAAYRKASLGIPDEEADVSEWEDDLEAEMDLAALEARAMAEYAARVAAKNAAKKAAESSNTQTSDKRGNPTATDAPQKEGTSGEDDASGATVQAETPGDLVEPCDNAGSTSSEEDASEVKEEMPVPANDAGNSIADGNLPSATAEDTENMEEVSPGVSGESPVQNTSAGQAESESV